jgi:hypothetical protein
MGNHKLTRGVDGVGGKVKGDRMEAVPGGEGRVGFEGEHVIEGKFNVGKEIRPAVGGERHVTSS